MFEEDLGKCAAARSDFDREGSMSAARSSGDAFQGFTGDEEVLPETLAQA